MLTILAYMGIAALILLLLYLIARRVPILGDALSFPLILVVRPLVILQKLLEKAGSFCFQVFEKSLRYPSGVTHEGFHGSFVIARLLLLLESIVIALGDFYGTLQTLPLLFGGAGAVSLPGSFAIPSSLLFVCMGLMYGHGLLEAVGLVGAHLFSNMTDKVRKWLGILCAIGFALSVVFGVLFWVFKGWYIADPDSAGVLAIPVLALVGLILTGSLLLTLAGLVAGFTGLLSVVFWFLSCGFHFVASVVSIVLSPVDVFVRYITHGRWSIYIDLLGHDPHKPLPSPFPDNNAALPPGQTSVGELPEHASSIDADSDNVQVFPVLTHEMEEKMSNPDKNASLHFVGLFGSRMFTPVDQAIERLDARESILSNYSLDLSSTHRQTRLAGIRDLSPSDAEIKAALLHWGTEDNAYATLLSASADPLVETHLALKHIPALFAYFIDCHQLVNAVEKLEAVKRRHPLASQVVITQVSALDMLNKGVQTGISDMVVLQQEGIIDTVMVLDPLSSFASIHGGDTQLRFLAQAVISLIIADKHSPTNQSCVSIFRQYQSISPFTALSFASQAIAMGNMPKRWSWLPGVSDQAGTGNYGDILAQVREATNRVITEEATTTFPAQVQTDTMCTILINIPLELRDSRFHACVRDNALYVGTHHPFATALTVRGNGCQYPHTFRRFLVQASCLYPLQPASLKQLQEGRTTNVTPLYPVTAREPQSSNGHVPVNEPTGKTQTTKAVAPTRQKKSAPTAPKRVARKNTRQAK